MAWYKTGTISVTNGSANVVGSGTAWVANASAGEAIRMPDGQFAEIASITSDTSLVLASAYTGATVSGQSYTIQPSQSYIRDLAAKAAALLNDFASMVNSIGQGKFPDGTVDAPGIRFSSDENTGLRRTGADSMALVAGGADKARVDTSGLVLLTARLRNVADTFSGLFQTAITAARTWTFPDKDGTVAMVSDITKAQVGLGNADNTSDASKPVSTAQQAALDLKAPHIDPAVTNSLHSGAVVKNVAHDTSKDSDGGAWRERCMHTSWYNESLGFTGKWLGQLATTAAAWATSGAAAGDGFQNTTDGKFYVLTGTSTASEITRGNVRKAPALPLLVAQNTPMARVVVYDGTQSTRPMWRVFAYTGKTINSVRMLDGKLFVGTTTGLFVEDLVADSIGKAERYTSTTTPAIVNSSVNDVAVTALETAPIDAATGLPTPTIAVGTAGGVSVIKDDGTVVHSASTVSATGVGFDYQGRVSWLYNNLSARTVHVGQLGASFAAVSASTPMVADGATGYNAAAGYVSGTLGGTKAMQVSGSARGGTSGLERYIVGNSTANTVVAAITNTYNSSWLVGDIRRALLADTTAETISASGDLVTNGTFPTDTSGWTSVNSTLSVVSGALRVTATGASPIASTPIATVVGRSYVVSVPVVNNTTGKNTFIFVGSGSASANIAQTTISTGPATAILSFVAVGTTTYVSVAGSSAFVAGDYFDADNISVKLAEPDRCVKNKGLIVNGSITKTAVAAGAGLVAYSGFSVANFLEQPYSADLDFGTADFEKPIWVAVAATQTALETIWCRDSATTGKRIKLQVNASGYLTAEAYDGTTSRVATGTVSVRDGVYRLVSVRYVAATGTLTIKVNNATYASATGTPLLTLSNASAIFRVGLDCQGANPGTSVSACLLRVSATVASDDQLDYIYRTELALFQAGAQCTLAGSSAYVTALTYDPDTTLLQAGTSWGRSSFKDLTRVDSEATSVGAITSLSAVGGVVLTGGASSARVYMPALSLRDELRRKAEARRALGKVPEFFDYTATASQTAFVAPKGYTVKALYKNGTLMRETTTGVYWTRSNDGFQETATLSVGASASDWISLMCVRA